MTTTTEGVERGLTVKEAANIIGCHEETVRRWIASGRIHAIKLGSTIGWRIHPSELQQFVPQPRDAA